MTRLYGEPLPGYGRDPLAQASPPFTPESPAWDGPRHSQARPAWRRWLLWLLPAALAAAIAGVVLAVTQGGNAAPSGRTAVIASHAPRTGSVAANQLVCKHYLAQRDHVKNLAQPTLADAMQFETDVTVDAAGSSGRLHKDLEAMATAMQASRSDYAASVRVYDDCTKG